MKTATKIGKNPKPIDNIDRTFMIFNWLIGVFACAAIIGQVISNIFFVIILIALLFIVELIG